MNIILLGAPGSGKGTIAEKLNKKYNFLQFSTGDIFRKHIADNSNLGLEAQKYINKGHLVPDEITNKMVELFLEDIHDNLIFDGYPRTINQANKLESFLSKYDSNISKVFLLDVSDEILIERLIGRLVCPVCKRSYHISNRPPKKEGICDFDGAIIVHRPDDELDKIKIRLKDYEIQTKPLIAFYSEKGLLFSLKISNKSSDEVFNDLEKELKITNDNN